MTVDSTTDAGRAGQTRGMRAASAPGGDGSATPGACPNLVGRGAELDCLSAAFDDAAGGRALAVLIGGDAGIGKSRLVEEFCDRVRLRGATVAKGMCVPAHGGLPYAPVLGILRDLGRQLRRPTAAAHVWRLLGDEVDGRAGGEPDQLPDTPAGPLARTMFFESILQALVELADTSPIVVVFEDLQWADPASTQLLDFLVRNLGDARVLAVGTYRNEDLGQQHPLTPWLAELGRHARVSRLALGPLDRVELASLIEGDLGAPPDSAVLESVWTRSQGNPFFAEQLIAARHTTALPTPLHDVINNRVRQFSGPAQNLLAIVAAAGAAVDHRLLAVVVGEHPDALDRSIEETVDKKILVVDDTGSGYTFRHALIRDAVYDAMLPARRARIHRTIAAALVADLTLGPSAPGHRVAELASHWWASGDQAAALKPSVQAAEAAVAVHAFSEAVAFLERALLADERSPDATAAAGFTRAQLLEMAADVAYLAGSTVRAVELARAAVAAVDAQREPIVAARCHTLLGRNLWGVGDSAAAFDAYRRAIELLPADPPTVELARLLAEEARGDMMMSRFRSGEQRAREAVAAARAVGAREVEGNALNTLGVCRSSLGFPDEAVPLIQQSLAIAEEFASPDDVNRAYGNLAAILVEMGRLEDAASVMFDSVAVGEELWGIRLNGATGNGVEALVRLGRYAEAEQVLAQLGTHALGVCAPAPWTLPTPMMIRRGRFDAAADLVATAREMTSRLQDVQHAAAVLGVAAELDLERGRPDEAAVHIEQALVLAARSDDETLLPELCASAVRAVADQFEAARADGASPAAEPARRRADEIVATVHGVVVGRAQRGAVLTPRTLAADAQTAAERSRLDGSDPQLWAEAAQRWQRSGERHAEAYCRWREAEAVLAARGGRVRAVECLDQAWRISRELGAEPLTTRILRLAQRGRLELHEGAPVAPSVESQVGARLGLTAREVEVLGQLAAGRSDREIGELLFISKKTVSVHVSNVLRKLSVPRRVEAGKIGQAHGLGVPVTQ